MEAAYLAPKSDKGEKARNQPDLPHGLTKERGKGLAKRGRGWSGWKIEERKGGVRESTARLLAPLKGSAGVG
jgi:hypothetical protein